MVSTGGGRHNYDGDLLPMPKNRYLDSVLEQNSGFRHPRLEYFAPCSGVFGHILLKIDPVIWSFLENFAENWPCYMEFSDKFC